MPNIITRISSLGILRCSVNIHAFLVLASTLILSGCASHYGAATIVSNPPGAEIYDKESGEVIGNTPLTMHWKNGSGMREIITVQLSKNGYYPKTSAFWLDMRERNAKAARAEPLEVNVQMQKIGGQ